MIDRFEELVSELGKVFQLSLHPDKFNALSIEMNHLVIQIELDASQENLLIFTPIIELPPGKFRENVLQEALKQNSLEEPRPGIFCFIAKTNQLALYQSYKAEILDGKMLAGLIGSFYELAEKWFNNLKEGNLPTSASMPKPSMFGLRP